MKANQVNINKRETMEKDVQKLVDWLNSSYCKTDNDNKYSFTKGKKYFKILESAQIGTSVSVYGFIDTDGTILKANSSKAPHKTPRGSIYKDNEWNKVCYKYGVAYINGFANY